MNLEHRPILAGNPEPVTGRTVGAPGTSGSLSTKRERECPTCRGAEVVTRMVAPGDFWDEACPDCTCTCRVSEPDEFGNRDLIEDPDCPIHA